MSKKNIEWRWQFCLGIQDGDTAYLKKKEALSEQQAKSTSSNIQKKRTT